MKVRVLTANLWGLPWPVSRDRAGRKARFAEFLSDLRADIVGLQEVWWPWRARFPVAPLHIPRSWRDAGLALSGRLARDSRVHLVPFRHHRGADRLKRKGVLHGIIRAGELEVRVIVTHLQAGRRHAAIRLRQVQTLAALLERVRDPVVCLGDFNFHAGDDARSSELLADAGLRDTAIATGNLAPTFWLHGEPERFDRIYVRDGVSVGIRPQSVSVLSGRDNPWSDHAPVSAVLELKS